MILSNCKILKKLHLDQIKHVIDDFYCILLGMLDVVHLDVSECLEQKFVQWLRIVRFRVHENLIKMNHFIDEWKFYLVLNDDF
jgi:hypothetical protein